MSQEFTAKKEGDSVTIYKVQDLWDTTGLESVVDTFKLNEEDLWVFNNQNVTHETLEDHIRRISQSTLDSAITLYSDGRIADGFHRLLYANINNIDKIPVRKLIIDPEPLHILTVEQYLAWSQKS